MACLVCTLDTLYGCVGFDVWFMEFAWDNSATSALVRPHYLALCSVVILLCLWNCLIIWFVWFVPLDTLHWLFLGMVFGLWGLFETSPLAALPLGHTT